ncbi:shikimate kinase [Thermoactinomyces intermedius]|jgi:shikimate kinase|uniref:Shikimate kinase n=1 Tax=Thermoactinomyces intermedius TaxID=2024 RepID=A0A8I1AD74_THEIN|nr:shikimate kinase [Thermoactinomyces intermedius]MBA4549376.1 shikimate kinase [Thermoactinomyces intermedius]MBA4837299.1 shikimate kinase [Thermoactinomyces intermedius]MBH8595657.1 shikimate kinase [Thermoactinomyces intermedius]
MKVPDGLSCQEQNLVLIGFMGAGKTTVGEQVAGMLGFDFADTDRELEKVHHMSVPQMFARKGEAWFRRQERDLIVRLCAGEQRKVLSLGGGAYLQEEVRRVCLKHGLVVFLDVSWEYWKEERYPRIRDNRPVLQDKTMEEIKRLFFERRRQYALNHASIAITNRKDTEQAAGRIAAFLRRAREAEKVNP